MRPAGWAARALVHLSSAPSLLVPPGVPRLVPLAALGPAVVTRLRGSLLGPAWRGVVGGSGGVCGERRRASWPHRGDRVRQSRRATSVGHVPEL